MDERPGQPEAEVAASDVGAMTSPISDLTYFRRQVNESLMKLQRSLLGERQDGGGQVTPQSSPTASGGEVRVSVFLITVLTGTEMWNWNHNPQPKYIITDKNNSIKQ